MKELSTKDVKADASIWKHCEKKIEYKLKEIEKERLKQEKYEKREKIFWWKLINYLEELVWANPRKVL